MKKLNQAAKRQSELVMRVENPATFTMREAIGMKELQPKPEETRPSKPRDQDSGGTEPHRVPPDEHVEDQLDEALDESFPASDPPSITPPKP